MAKAAMVVRDPDILGGVPVFARTRVPVQALFDYFVGGNTLDDFLDDFPTVDRSQAIAVLEETKHAFLAKRP